MILIRLDYFDLISPYPLKIDSVGSIKSPTLREIAALSYYTYGLYITCLKKSTEYSIILHDDSFAKIIEQALDFFFVEKVLYDKERGIFLIVNETQSETEDSDAEGTIHGFIGRQNYASIVSLILQRLYVTAGDSEAADMSKITNKRGRQIYEKILKGRKKLNEAKAKQVNDDLTLPNIISSVAAFSKNTNYHQIWELTVYQLFDLFDRLQIIDRYDIQTTQVSVWGDKQNTFELGLWNKNIYSTKHKNS